MGSKVQCYHKGTYPQCCQVVRNMACAAGTKMVQYCALP
jgi:hypothetical protein